MTDAARTPEVTIVPANEASWEDIQVIFGARGAAATCQCQRYKLRPREAFASFPAEERAHRLRVQTDCGHPESNTTSSLVACTGFLSLRLRVHSGTLAHASELPLPLPPRISRASRNTGPTSKGSPTARR